MLCNLSQQHFSQIQKHSKIYEHMNFIVYTSSGSLVTIGPCSYYLAKWETTFGSMSHPILLLSWLSMRFPLSESWLQKPIIYHIYIPTRQYEFVFKHVFCIAQIIQTGPQFEHFSTGSPSQVLLKLCIRITYEIYSSVLKPAIYELPKYLCTIEYFTYRF